jgi:hypothetical protein
LIPGFERRSADKIIKKGLESKLCSISKIISDMEMPLDDSSKKAESIYLKLNSVNILLSKYAEMRFGSGITALASGQSGQKSGHLNESMRTDLQKNEEYYKSQFLYQSGRIASLIEGIEPIQLSLCSKREEMDYAIKKERLGLQSLVEKVSSKHEVSMMNGEYRLSHQKKKSSLIPAVVTAACMAVFMITYNHDDVAKSLKNIPLIERVENYISGEEIEIKGNEYGANGNDLEQIVDGNTSAPSSNPQYPQSGVADNINPQYASDPINRPNSSQSPVASGSSRSKKLLSEDYFAFPSELRQLGSITGQYAIYIDKKTQKLSLFRKAEWVRIAEYDVSTGRNFGNKMESGDYKTPETPYLNGNSYKPYFMITSINDSSRWNFENIMGAYGPWFMRLNCGTWSGRNYNPAGQCPIGIHGVPDLAIYNPDFKDKIGTPASHGCIRMYNNEVSELRYIVGVGTPVFVIGDESYLQQTASQNTSQNTSAHIAKPAPANASRPIPGNTFIVPEIPGVQEPQMKYGTTAHSGPSKPGTSMIEGGTEHNALH